MILADVWSVVFVHGCWIISPQLSRSLKASFDRIDREVAPRQTHIFSYNAAKGGTVHLTKLMSAEFQKLKIRVNSIAPGYFPSEMTAKESNDEQKSHVPDEKIQEKGHVPHGRAGHDEEMAQAVLFLTKNCYVNGEIIAVDGGVLNVVAGR